MIQTGSKAEPVRFGQSIERKVDQYFIERLQPNREQCLFDVVFDNSTLGSRRGYSSSCLFDRRECFVWPGSCDCCYSDSGRSRQTF
jgi:hypothetical protein